MRRTTAKGSAGTWSRQSRNSVDELLGEEALTRRQDLAELDVGRPQALEGPPQPARQPGARPGWRRAGGRRRYQPATAVPSTVDHPDHARAGRKPPPAGEAGCLGAGAGPDLVDTARATPGGSRSSTHGGCDEKAPKARSDGSGPAAAPPSRTGHRADRTVLRRPSGLVRRGRADHQAAVVAAEAEGVRQSGARLPGAGPRRARRRGGSRGRAARSRRWGG